MPDLQLPYALVKNGVVVYLIEATRAFLDSTAGTGMYDVAVPLDAPVPSLGVGWTFDGTDLVAPPPPPDPAAVTEPTPDPEEGQP